MDGSVGTRLEGARAHSFDTMERTDAFVKAYRDDPSIWGYFFTPIVAASFVITLLLSLIVSPTISPLLSSKYRSLGLYKRTFDTLWPSTLHALTVSGMALYLLVTGRMGTDSLTRIYSKEPLGFAIMQIALGYFLADLIVCLSDRRLRSDKGSVAHHLVGISSVCFGLYTQGKYMYFVVMFFITEVSTPFLNLWLTLRFTDNKSSWWYVFASLGLWATFSLCRIFVIPWRWYVAVGSLVHPAASLLVRIELRFMVVAHYVLLDILNCYWFYRLSLGGLKMLRSFGRKS